MQTKNIVKIELEKMGIPENAVEDIIKFHGGVYGMVPREVWDMKCVPIMREDFMRVVWMQDGSEFCKDVAGLIRKDNWKLQVEGDSMRFFSIVISIDVRNIGDMSRLQLRQPWIRFDYDLQCVFKFKGQTKIKNAVGEGFLQSFTEGILTITKESSPKSLIIAKGPLTKFNSLYHMHCYRIMEVEPVIHWSSDSSDSSEGRSGHYVLSDSD